MNVIRELREVNHMSIESFAKRYSVSAKLLREWEGGKSEPWESTVYRVREEVLEDRKRLDYLYNRKNYNNVMTGIAQVYHNGEEREWLDRLEDTNTEIENIIYGLQSFRW